MTLLDDLQALDLSDIIDAKADINIAISADEITRLIDEGAVTRTLGDVGLAIEVAVAAVEDPATIVEPLGELLLSIVEQIDTGDVPVAEYVEAVAAAARVIASLITMLTGDSNAIQIGESPTIGDALELAGGALGDNAVQFGSEISQFRSLVQSVERGLPNDVDELLAAALPIILPFDLAGLDATREWALAIEAQLGSITIEPRLIEGLVGVLADIEAAANAGDLAALNAALGRLERVRQSTIDQLAGALRSVAGALAAVRIENGVGALHDLRSTLAGADETVFELLDGWRSMLVEAADLVDEIDAAEFLGHAGVFLDEVETQARGFLLDGINGAVEVVKDWLRGLLREIPIRPLRLQLSDAIEDVARAIEGADVDAPVDALRLALGEVTAVLVEADPAAAVQSAVAEVEVAIRQLLDDIEAALGDITDAINNVAAEAEAVLSRAVAGLADFSVVVDDITAAIEAAGIVEAAEEIAKTLAELSDDIGELLGSAPLPDALRQGVEQIISTLEDIDLDAAIGEPLREVAAQLQIPDDVATTVREGLEAVADAITSLVPEDVIADLDALIAEAFAELENLDISALTDGISGAIGDAAEVFEGIRLVDHVEPAGAAFDELLGAVDQVHPRRLLAPAIDLYNEIFQAVPIPDPETMASRAGTVVSQAGESMGRAAAEPVRTAVSPSATTPPAGSDAQPAVEAPPDDLRPGDVVRLIGFLPMKLREAIDVLEDGEAASMLEGIGDAIGGVGASLLRVRDQILDLDRSLGVSFDTTLAPLASAQLNAQLAVRNSTLVAEGSVDVSVSLGQIALAGPADIEHQLRGELALVHERCGAVCGSLSGDIAADLDSVAGLLDRLVPADLLSDVDSLLAALDPEPIAAEFDALLGSIVDLLPDFLSSADAELREFEARVRALIDEFNPGALMQRFLGVFDVIREELALLDPARLADELGEVHAAIRAAVSAYDPRVIVGEIDVVIVQVAASIRGLDPAGLVPDLTGIADQVARVSDILPVNALEGVGAELEAVGAELRSLNIDAMLEAVNALTPQLAEGIEILIESVRTELVNLLQSIQYSSSNASASVTVSAEVSV